MTVKRLLAGSIGGLAVAAGLWAFGTLDPLAAGDEPGSTLEAQMAAWKERAAPGEHHAQLARLSGTWNALARFWPAPELPAEESRGVMTSEMILGGRFLRSHFVGSDEEAPFEGLGIDGYDRGEGKTVGIWIDTMSTSIQVYEGTIDEDGRVRRSTSAYRDPMTAKMKTVKTVTTIDDDDSHTYESWERLPDGEWFRSMEIVFTRR